MREGGREGGREALYTEEKEIRPWFAARTDVGMSGGGEKGSGT